MYTTWLRKWLATRCTSFFFGPLVIIFDPPMPGSHFFSREGYGNYTNSPPYRTWRCKRCRPQPRYGRSDNRLLEKTCHCP